MIRNRYAFYSGGRYDPAKAVREAESALPRYKREKREREEAARNELLRPRRWIDRTHPKDND